MAQALEQDMTGRATAAFRAVRGELHDASADNPDDLDISRTLHGAAAVTGKAVYSANNALRQADSSQVERNEAAKDAKRTQELLRMAAWDAARTTVGGVEMTNAEAQGARREIIDNGDRYAKWAVEHGYLAEGEEEHFKDAARRMYELKELERENGRMTEGQQREWDQLQASRAGQAVNDVTAQAHLGRVELTKPSAQVSMTPERDNPFPTAPNVNAAFANAHTPPPVLETNRDRPVSTPANPQSSAPAF